MSPWSLLLLLVALFGATTQAIASLTATDVAGAFPGEYVVTFWDGYTLEQHFEFVRKNLSNTTRFRRFGYGYRAQFDNHTRDHQVRLNPGVRHVESNRPIFLDISNDRVEFEPGEQERSNKSHVKKAYTELDSPNAPYGLQMITTPKDRFDIPIQNNGTYNLVLSAGADVRIYVLDSGIRLTHSAFAGRASNFGGLRPSDKSPYCDEPMADSVGHGTHVAGIAGARTYGVAPFAQLVNVKEFGKGKEIALVAQAVLNIIDEHVANKEKTLDDFFGFRGSKHINISWALKDESALMYTLIKANEAGISIFAAAGNKNRDASNVYPWAHVQANCIAAVDNTYHKWDDSTYGSVIDYVAPGKDVISLGISSDTALLVDSGTSMACPHAAGAAAIFTSWRKLTHPYPLSETYVYSNSIANVITGFRKHNKNLLVTTGIHSPWKYRNEPFRWGGDWPEPNTTTQEEESSSPLPLHWTPTFPPSSRPATPLFTNVSTSTRNGTYERLYYTIKRCSRGLSLPAPESTIPIPSTSATQTTPSSGITCSANQIAGSCSQASLPSATPNSGITPVVCNKAGAGEYVMFNATQASEGASTYCSNLVSNVAVLSRSSPAVEPGYVTDAAVDGGYVAIVVGFDVDACDQGTAPADQRLDFSTWSEDDCYLYLTLPWQTPVPRMLHGLTGIRITVSKVGYLAQSVFSGL